MNLKTTPILFGLMLGLLWLFGLLLVYKKAPVDENLIMRSMQGPDVKVDTVVITYKDAKDPSEELKFEEVDSKWYLKQHGQQVRVESFKIDQIVRSVQNARRYE